MESSGESDIRMRGLCESPFLHFTAVSQLCSIRAWDRYLDGSEVPGSDLVRVVLTFSTVHLVSGSDQFRKWGRHRRLDFSGGTVQIPRYPGGRVRGRRSIQGDRRGSHDLGPNMGNTLNAWHG